MCVCLHVLVKVVVGGLRGNYSQYKQGTVGVVFPIIYVARVLRYSSRHRLPWSLRLQVRGHWSHNIPTMAPLSPGEAKSSKLHGWGRERKTIRWRHLKTLFVKSTWCPGSNRDVHIEAHLSLRTRALGCSRVWETITLLPEAGGVLRLCRCN